jgi:probable F420-dependent oxidoreductase
MSKAASELRVGILAGDGCERVAELEALPIDSLWVGGHLSSPNPSPEAMMGLARLAAMTERVRIGTSVLLLPLYPPAIIAKQIADLDRVTDGRVTLGVGVGGEYPQEFRAVQVAIADRGRRADDMIPLIRQLWSAEEVTYESHFFSIRDVRIHPAPIQPGGPPIVVGGRQEAAMRRAATLGDGWFPYLYSPRRYAASVETVKRIAAEIGRDLSGFEWCVWIFLNIESDGDAARERAARSLPGTDDRNSGPMVDRVAAAGTADEVATKLKRFYDAGARHFVFCPATAGADPRRVLDRLVGDVLPVLREHAAPG